MTELKFVEFASLNNSQVDKVAHLMFETGYYNYISLSNKLNLSPLQFQIRQTLLPCAKYTKVLRHPDGTIMGFFIAATKTQVLKLKNNVPNWYNEKYDIKNFQKKLFHFYLYKTNNHDLILHEMAIDINWRGQGLFWVLYEELCRIAKRQNCNRIVFAAWESKPALKIYLHCGAKIMGKMNFSHLGFKDNLVECYFDI